MAGGAVAAPPTVGDWAGQGGQGNGAGHAPSAGPSGAGPAAGGMPGTALPGQGVSGNGAAGNGNGGLPWNGLPGAARPDAATAAPPHVTQPLAIGNPAGPAIGDLLPAVKYGPPGAGAAGALPSADGQLAARGGYPLAAGRADGRPARRRSRLLFVLALALVGVSASIILPVVGTLAALAALVSLRAADLTQGRLSRRRAGRGARASDSAVTVLTYPVMLAWSVITGILLAPLALAAAGIAAGITIVAVPVNPFPRAVAYGAGALVACYGLGPGSGGARRQLGRLFDAVGRSPGASAVALAGASALALAAMATAASQPALYWPLHHLGTPSGNLHALLIAVHHARIAIVRLAGRVVG